MYIFNFALTSVVMIPSMLVYGVMVKSHILFFLFMLIGTVFIPLIPMVIATVIGAGIMAISARMKHKNIVNILISLVAVLGVIILSFLISSTKMSNKQFFDLSSSIVKELEKCYPPSILFSNAVLNNNFFDLIIFVIISAILFVAFVFVIQKYFTNICSNLKSSVATRDYKIEKLVQTSQLKALYNKDIRRYFASSIYVMNTGIGYILMIVFSIAVVAMGQEKINTYLHISNAVQIYAPLIFAFTCGISAPTTSAVSIEGKQWWITNVLPVKPKTIFDSKMLVSFTVAIPCYLVSVLIMSFAVKMNLMQIIALLIVPLIFIAYSVVIGLYINIKMPLFNWESETTVVKQSTAVLVSMIVDFVSLGVLIGSTFAIKGINQSVIMLVVSTVFLIITAVIYCKMQKIKLIDID